jgi:hypothetical protein
MTDEQVMKHLNEMVAVVELPIGVWNTFVNVLNTPQQTQVVVNAQLINELEKQIGPQVTKARESLEAIKNADGVDKTLEEKN